MKRLSVLIITLLLCALGLGASLVHAQRFQTADNVTVSNPTPIHQTIFVSGKTVDITSEVFGDVFCVGQAVTVSATVHGDLICAGQTVNVNGRVDGDARLAGQSVTVSSAVGGNATVGAQSFVLDSKGSVGGDASIGTTDATINGGVSRDLAVGGTTLLVGSTVGRNVQASVTNLRLNSGARIGGNVELTSANPVNKAPGAVVSGKITRTAPTTTAHKHHWWSFTWVWLLYWFVTLLVLAMVLALLFPRALQAVSDHALPRPWKALLTGFVASIVAPIVILLLMATVIGLPLALLAGLAWGIVLILSGPASAFYLGRLILRRSRSALLIMLVGAVVLTILYFIPFLDIIVILLALWTGIGMLLLELFRRTPKPAYQVEPVSKAKKS